MKFNCINFLTFTAISLLQQPHLTYARPPVREFWQGFTRVVLPRQNFQMHRVNHMQNRTIDCRLNKRFLFNSENSEHTPNRLKAIKPFNYSESKYDYVGLGTFAFGVGVSLYLFNLLKSDKEYTEKSSNNVQKKQSAYPFSFLTLFALADEEPKSLESILQEKIKVVEKRVRGKIPAEQITILLGRTGSGKSTVFNYVQGNPLVAQDDPKRGIIIKLKTDTSRNEDEGAIVHGYRSGTSYPSISRDGKFFDCPGFSDTRGVDQDIINAYSLYTLFKAESSMRCNVQMCYS